MHYSYEEVVEMAVALFAIRCGVRPYLVADYLVTNRTTLHRTFRRALATQPATVLKASWVKSREKHQTVLANKQLLRLHDRMRYASDSYDLVQPGMDPELADRCGQEELGLFPDATADTRIPLTRLVLELIYWAERAPDIKPGRKVKGTPSPTPSSGVRA
jgi:hypothetical protein